MEARRNGRISSIATVLWVEVVYFLVKKWMADRQNSQERDPSPRCDGYLTCIQGTVLCRNHPKSLAAGDVCKDMCATSRQPPTQAHSCVPESVPVQMLVAGCFEYAQIVHTRPRQSQRVHGSPTSQEAACEAVMHPRTAEALH